MFTEDIASVEALAQGIMEVQSEGNKNKEEGNDGEKDTGATVITEGQHRERVARIDDVK